MSATDAPHALPDGVLVVDKPSGASSFDVIRRLKPVLRRRKTGFLGTLDPFATGVLPLCLGEATKLADALAGAKKEYLAELRLGVGTDTGDRTGRAVRTAAVPALAHAALVEACAFFRGEHEQTPPMHSAVHVNGERLYEKARRGEVVDRPARRITIHDLALRQLEPDRLELRVVCSTGTYVRVLGEDIAHRLGTEGHLAALRRTRSGGFALERAATIDEILADPAGAFGKAGTPLDRLRLPGFVEVTIDDAGAAAVGHGAAVRREQVRRASAPLPPGARVAIRQDDRLLALGVVGDDDQAAIRPTRVLVRREHAD